MARCKPLCILPRFLDLHVYMILWIAFKMQIYRTLHVNTQATTLTWALNPISMIKTKSTHQIFHAVLSYLCFHHTTYSRRNHTREIMQLMNYCGVKVAQLMTNLAKVLRWTRFSSSEEATDHSNYVCVVILPLPYLHGIHMYERSFTTSKCDQTHR
jgi:hypothetical protein